MTDIIVAILIISGWIYIAMRRGGAAAGCHGDSSYGSGPEHGEEESKENVPKLGKEVREMAKDPVCGMNVDEKKAAATYEYKGITYYFCSVGCRDKFVKAPEKFIKQETK